MSQATRCLDLHPSPDASFKAGCSCGLGFRIEEALDVCCGVKYERPLHAASVVPQRVEVINGSPETLSKTDPEK